MIHLIGVSKSKRDTLVLRLPHLSARHFWEFLPASAILVSVEAPRRPGPGSVTLVGAPIPLASLVPRLAPNDFGLRTADAYALERGMCTFHMEPDDCTVAQRQRILVEIEALVRLSSMPGATLADFAETMIASRNAARRALLPRIWESLTH